jgi:(R,R)-butanediol dehydrogenase / meso-butanediol dehydrogenase / diacetyl reductase
VRAAVYYGRGDIRLEEVVQPRPAGGELLLQITMAGICGTDAHEFSSGPVVYSIGEPHAVTGHSGPIIPGHEFVGRVVDVGSGVGGFKLGDLVVSGAGISCGECHWCRRSKTNLCANYSTAGLQRNGALAEYCAVPATTCVDVGPYGLTSEVAALAQPMSIVVHAMRQGRLEPGDLAVVIGVGGIGAFLTYAASRIGAVVVATDFDRGRLEVASSLGAGYVVDASSEDAVISLLSSEGQVPTVIYEVTGSPGGLKAALRMATRGTRIVAVGLQGATANIDLRDLTTREMEILGTNAHCVARDLPEALGLLASREASWSDVAPTALSLDRLVDDGIKPLVERRSAQIKTLVDPWAESSRATTA